jgi:t-SNARE complex subunit (syntaxin)
MNDRLGDIPSWAVGADSDDDENGDVEMGEVSGHTQPKHMEHFFREVESIKSDIEAVKSATKMVGDINDRALQATTTEEENELSRKLKPLIDQTTKQAKRTKTLLELLKEETKKLKEQNNIKQSDQRYVLESIF